MQKAVGAYHSRLGREGHSYTNSYRVGHTVLRYNASVFVERAAVNVPEVGILTLTLTFATLTRSARGYSYSDVPGTSISFSIVDTKQRSWHSARTWAGTGRVVDGSTTSA